MAFTGDLSTHPVLTELSRALWRVGDLRGAAVLVGAGFSRNAELPGPTSQLSPSWYHLRMAMLESLGSRTDDTSDPLEVAEQYEAIFGRQALDGLIRERVSDLSLQPGVLHRRLLSLPWAEVLTTNYDTLLERCAEKSPSQTFEVVRSQSDIPRTRSPRIVKLHGTLPFGPFVISSEDYRTYPRRHAALVNLVQQVLLENHLVLLGFSATDPNFLAWTGWVRDNLGDSARRLILVGLFDLSSAAQRVLDNRGVTVIDLSGLVAHEDAETRHSVALDRFFNTLERGKPPKPSTWDLQEAPPDVQLPIPGSSVAEALGPQHWFDADAARRRLEARIPAWTVDREGYPGWIVAPTHVRDLLGLSLSADQPNLASAVQSMAMPNRARAAYELAWRFDVAMCGLPSWLANEINLALQTGNGSFLSSYERVQMALFALADAREGRDKFRFDALRDWIKAYSPEDPDLVAMVAYEEAIWARDGLELGRLPELINLIGGRDPIFLMRRAALWCELGAYEQAFDLIVQALADLRERRVRDRSSIWVSSRYGWALYLARRARWSRSFRNAKSDPIGEHHEEFRSTGELGETFCDPVQELHNLDEELSQAERRTAERRIARRPGFDPGHFTHHIYGSGTIEPLSSVVGDIATRLALRVGLPNEIEHSIINRERLNRMLSITPPILDSKLLPLCALIAKADGGTIDRFLNRISVANLSPDLVQDVLASTLAAVDALLPFLSPQTAQAVGRDGGYLHERVGVFLEIASRLAIRLDPDNAASVLHRALTWARDPRWQHTWSSESLERLLARALDVIPPSGQVELLSSVVMHPLPGEKQVTHLANRWPEPCRHLKLQRSMSRPTSADFTARIKTLIERIRSGSPLDRNRALIRLERLHKANILSDDENEGLASALWARLEPNNLPSETSFRKFVFLKLPQVFPGQAEAALRAALLPDVADIKMTDELLGLLAAERSSRDGGGPYFKLTPEEAVGCLDATLAICAEQRAVGDDSTSVRAQAHLGAALAIGILPMLSEGQIESDRFEHLIVLLKSRDFPSLTEVWPQVVRLDACYHDEAMTAVVEALLSNRNECVQSGLWAIERWRVLAKANELVSLPQVFVETLLGVVASRRFVGLAGALSMLTNCYQEGMLGAQDLPLLLAGLNALIDETSSVEAVLEDEASAIRAGTLTLVRCEAARLAQVLKAAGVQSPVVDRWIQIIPDDPFPEVRSLALGDV